MPGLVDQFNERSKEVDLYFDFLKKVVVTGASLEIPASPQPHIEEVDKDLQKVLKANALVLLYNLVESSVRDGLRHIHDSIFEDKLAYQELTSKLKNIWLNSALAVDANKAIPSAKVFGLVEKILAEEIAGFDGKLSFIQGNLDAQKIREVCTQYGLSHQTTKKTKGGHLLVRVKQGRNDLAHGNKSFIECGRDLTFKNLQAMKNQVTQYLRDILRNIERYVAKKEYRVKAKEAAATSKSHSASTSTLL